MRATYTNEYGGYEDCLILACTIDGLKYLIEIDGEQGYCSCYLVDDNF